MSRRRFAVLGVDEIQETFYVRLELKQDRVRYFREIIESGVEVDPIKVTLETKQLRDGRHRLGAYREVGIKEIRCELVEEEPRANLIIRALEDNMGGPLPPSGADINHTIRLLLEEGVSRKRIIDELSRRVSLPRNFLRRHIDDVQSEMAKVRLRLAVDAVVDGGLTVPQAAKRHNVNVDTLRAHLKNIKRKKSTLGLDELKAGLSNRYKGLSNVNAALSKKLIADYRDGEATEKHVRNVLDHIAHLIDGMRKAHRGWIRRLEALTQLPDLTASTPRSEKRPKRKAATVASRKKTRKPAPKKQKKAQSPRDPGVSALRKMGL